MQGELHTAQGKDTNHNNVSEMKVYGEREGETERHREREGEGEGERERVGAASLKKQVRKPIQCYHYLRSNDRRPRNIRDKR